MIYITPENSEQYLEKKVENGVFDFIEKQLNQNIGTLVLTGIGCFCSPGIETKIGTKIIFVEYYYEVVGSMTEQPLIFKIKPNEVILFDTYPNKIIDDKIAKVKKALSEYSKLN